MKLLYFCTLLVSYFICGITFGAEISRTSKILDDFKLQQKEYLFDVIPFSQTEEQKLFERENKVNWLESFLERIENAKNQYKVQKDFATRKKLTLENVIKEYDTSIDTTIYQINQIIWVIAVKENEITSLIWQISDMKKKIIETRATLMKYLSIIYSKSSVIYNNQDVDIFRVIVMNEWDISSLFLDIYYKSLVTRLWKWYVDDYRMILWKFYLIKQELEEKKSDLQQEKDRLDYEKRQLIYKRAEKDQLLITTKWEESLYEQYLMEQDVAEKNLRKQWQEMYASYIGDFKDIAKKYNCTDTDFTNTVNEAEECVRVKQFYQMEQKLLQYTPHDSSSSWNILRWPVQSNRISTLFHDEWYYREFWSEHDAIDIPVNQWSDVKSVAPGYVYYILPPTPGWYSYLAIRHPDWIVSVYWHLSEVKVSMFQFVQQGEIIWKSGWEPWTPGAWPMTTWPHLHFEIWRNREPIDPLRYLNLSDLNMENLPSRYKYKYIEDVKELYGSWANISKYQTRLVIRWANETERQKYFLWQYATTAFNDWKVWTEESLVAKIDPSFMMCVWLAETSLWVHLKTAYNIWNIWNTDSGDTYSFSSAREGLNWMAKTFNNKFLSKYDKVSELSWWGNKTWSIYASSKTNWHNNVIHCLSAMKWRFIEDDYNFRIK